MTRQELVQLFSIERIGRAAAVFDREKLNWMNENYLRALPPEQLHDALQPFIASSSFAGEDEETLRKIAVTVQSAMVTLADIEGQMEIFFRRDDDPVSPEVPELIREGQVAVRLLRDKIAAQDELTENVFKEATKAVQKESGLKGKALFAPLRAAITLNTVGPDLAKFVEVIGKEKTLSKLDYSLSASASMSFVVK
jgi:nondiscriminating glutamyl-tRNA synthetase